MVQLHLAHVDAEACAAAVQRRRMCPHAARRQSEASAQHWSPPLLVLQAPDILPAMFSRLLAVRYKTGVQRYV